MSPGPAVADSTSRPAARDVLWEIRLTMVVLAAATAMILLYAVLTPEGPNREALRLSLAAALLLHGSMFAFATPRLARAARQGAGGLLGLVACFGFVTIWVALDGGTASPINAVYAVPLTVAVLRVPSASRLILGLVIAAHVLAALLAGALEIATALVWITQLGLMTAVTAWVAGARTAHRRQLLALTAELENLAIRDPLTQVLNRRGFEAALSVRTCELDDGTPTALMVIDLDHFKRVNDTYGHATGDKVLAAAARALGQAVREGDVLARTGGEEFAVALLGTDTEAAAVVAERIRRAVATCFTSPSVTASIGVRVAHGPTDVAELHLSADRAMYQAKEQGRDRVVLVEDAAQCRGTPRSRT